MHSDYSLHDILLSDKTSNLEVDPLSNTAAKHCRVLAFIVMQNKFIVAFLKLRKRPSNLDNQSPANPWIIFFETQSLVQMLHSVSLYHHAKNKKKL